MDDEPLSLGWVIALRLFIGGLFAMPGLLLIGTTLGVIDVIPWVPKDASWVQRLVLILVGLPFVSMGAMIASGLKDFSEEDTSVGQGVKHVLLLSFLIPLAFFLLWGGFGPGEREFTVITTVGSEVTTSSGDELLGRCLFGGFGIFVSVIILLYIHNQFIRKRRR